MRIRIKYRKGKLTYASPLQLQNISINFNYLSCKQNTQFTIKKDVLLSNGYIDRHLVGIIFDESGKYKWLADSFTIEY